MDVALARRVANALYGMLIADALAMPVHWFYNPADITKQVAIYPIFVNNCACSVATNDVSL
jgi:ADP-ribosylglycohydrolase